MALHVLGVAALLGRHQRYDHAALTGAGRAARTVLVVGGAVGQVDVHDAGDLLDVEATGGHVGGHQGGDAAAVEVGEALVALGLAATTVDHRGLHAHGVQLLGEAVGAVLGAGEQHRAAGLADDVGRQVRTIGRVGRPEQVGGLALVLHLGGDAVPRGVVEVGAGQAVGRAVERGREQHGLTLAAALVDDAAHTGQEAHVGHAVGLVDDDDRDVVELHVALLDEVFEPARAGDEHVDTTAQVVDLRALADAAVHRRRPLLADAAHVGQDRVDLGGELPGGGEHEGGGTVRHALAHAGDERRGEGERLARAGGCGGQDVTAGEQIGQRGRLDGAGRLDAVGGEVLRQVAGQPEVDERGRHGSPDRRGTAPMGTGAGSADLFDHNPKRHRATRRCQAE